MTRECGRLWKFGAGRGAGSSSNNTCVRPGPAGGKSGRSRGVSGTLRLSRLSGEDDRSRSHSRPRARDPCVPSVGTSHWVCGEEGRLGAAGLWARGFGDLTLTDGSGVSPWLGHYGDPTRTAPWSPRRCSGNARTCHLGHLSPPAHSLRVRPKLHAPAPRSHLAPKFSCVGSKLIGPEHGGC